MSKWSFDRTFAVLFVAVLILTGLRLTDVIASSAFEAITLVIAVGMIVFLAVIGGDAAKQGVLVVLLVGALGIAPALAPKTATEEFFSAAAQVIPVLLVVLAIEVRLFRIPRLPSSKPRERESWIAYQARRTAMKPTVVVTAGVMFVAVFALVAAELQSLSALASAHPEHEPPRNVYTAVAVGLVVVGFLALFGGPTDDAEASPGVHRSDERPSR